jgi:GDP-D-mannose dehydratase
VTDALVTGGTGFVGANVVRELIAAGATVRVLARASSDRRALEGVRAEIVTGDLLDPASLARAVSGVQTVYHVAADYRLWAPDPAALYRANVDGTRAVLDAAAQAGIGRVVYTSTVGALGIPKDGTPGTEDTPVSLADMVGPYKASKFLAERVAMEYAEAGLSRAAIGGLLAAIRGRRPPRFRVPYAVAWCGAVCMEGVARVTGGPPAVPLTAVRMARKRMYFSAAKAVRELGLPQTDVRVALREAVEWFAAHGYAGRRRAAS